MEYGLWLRLVKRGYAMRSLNPCSNGIWSLTWQKMYFVNTSLCLNPCSNGIWSLTLPPPLGKRLIICLNPCSNGIWSLTQVAQEANKSSEVLILVLMEYGLWPSKNLEIETQLLCVLILVLMEYGLWHGHGTQVHVPLARLNPCSNGIWSLTIKLGGDVN